MERERERGQGIIGHALEPAIADLKLVIEPAIADLKLIIALTKALSNA